MPLVLVLALFLFAMPAFSQDRPLPDPGVFFEQVKQRLQSDEDRQSAYTYVETRRELQLDKAGRPTGESVKVIESRRMLRIRAQGTRPRHGAAGRGLSRDHPVGRLAVLDPVNDRRRPVHRGGTRSSAASSTTRRLPPVIHAGQLSTSPSPPTGCSVWRSLISSLVRTQDFHGVDP